MTHDSSPHHPYILLEEPPEGTYKIGAKPVVIHCIISYHGSDMGYSKDGWKIDAIFDRHGNELEPVFLEETWTEIAPGVATSNPGHNVISGTGSSQEVCKEAISISAKACPLKVVFEAFSEYNDYDDWERCTYRSEAITTVFVAQAEGCFTTELLPRWKNVLRAVTRALRKLSFDR